MKRIIMSGCALFTAITTLAQQETKDSFYLLTPVEVRAVRAAENAPVTKTNISKKEISKNNLGQDIPFLLNQTPSVVVNSDAGNGVGYTGIRIRGTDATRINVTLNGIPYNDAESQGTFLSICPIFHHRLVAYRSSVVWERLPMVQELLEPASISVRMK